MDGALPAEYRLFFPLVPVLVVFAISLVDVGTPDSMGGRAGDSGASTASTPAPAALPPCCQKMPSRFSALPKYEIKFVGLNRGGVDYDAGNAIVGIVCSFSDQCP